MWGGVLRPLTKMWNTFCRKYLSRNFDFCEWLLRQEFTRPFSPGVFAAGFRTFATKETLPAGAARTWCGCRKVKSSARFRDAKPEVIYRKSWMTAASICHEAPALIVGPSSPAKDTICTVDGRVINIFAPLPDIPQHIVEPPIIGALFSHRPCATFRVLPIPCDVADWTETHTLCPGSAGELPFSFTGQAKSVARRYRDRIPAIRRKNIAFRQPCRCR